MRVRDARDEATELVTVPGKLWRYLGTKGSSKPFIPFQAQLDLLRAVQLPWPGIDPATGLAYPTNFAYPCGRRFGKTTILEKILWNGVLAPDDDFGPPVVRMTADTEEHAMKVWRLFIWHLENTPLKALVDRYSRENERVDFKHGAEIQLLSGKNPENLSGDAVTLWGVDESQDLSMLSYENLYPSTTERDGVIVMVGVAQKDGPFRQCYIQGEDPSMPEFAARSFPTSANPFVPKRRIELAAKVLTVNRFRQLYLAQWADELGRVFRNVDGCVMQDAYLKVEVDPDVGFGFVEPPKAGHTYYGGLDLARLSDWTVYTIWDSNRRMVAWDRFNQTDWKLLKDRVMQLYQKYNQPLTGVDSTGVGDAIVEDLVTRGMKVEEYAITTNPRKRQLIDRFAVLVGGGLVRYPKIGQLIRELKLMEAKRASDTSQVIVYEAPANQHDDFVISCSLAALVMPEQIYRLPPQGQRMLSDQGPPLLDDPMSRQRGAWEGIGA